MKGYREQISRRQKMDEVVTERAGWRGYQLGALAEGSTAEGGN